MDTTSYLLKNNEVLEINENKSFILNINSPCQIKAYINIDIKDSGKLNLVFNIHKYTNFELVIILKNINSEISYEFNLSDNSFLKLSSFDYSLNYLHSRKTINLNGYKSNTEVFEFASGNKTSTLDGDFFVNHNSSNTTCSATLNYLAKDNSTIKRNATATILKGMKESSSDEKIKGILISPNAKIESKPILIIDHDDVKASHGCAIGTVDTNEIYYLMSRGLSKEEAMAIITRSLVNPIKNAIANKDFLNITEALLDNSVNGEYDGL